MKHDRKVAEGYGHPGGMGGRKWDEYKPGKGKAIRFTRARVKNPLGDQNIPEASSCKYLGIILRSDSNWVDQVDYTVQKAWNALHFVMRVLKKRKWEYKKYPLHNSVSQAKMAAQGKVKQSKDTAPLCTVTITTVQTTKPFIMLNQMYFPHTNRLAQFNATTVTTLPNDTGSQT
jgi:hypothetical protein